MSIIDRFNRPLYDLRLSVIDQCNFRCSYCMPKEFFPLDYAFLPPEKWLSFSEIRKVVSSLCKLGLKKVKITGGEPLLRPFLPDLIEGLKKDQPQLEVDLISNGVLLPPLLPRLKAAGLDRITISLDSLDPNQFALMSGNGQRLELVLAAIDHALELGFSSLKLNTVIMRGQNEDQILPLTSFAQKKNISLRFIEFMDVGSLNEWSREKVYEGREVKSIIEKHFSLKALPPKFFGETATRCSLGNNQGEVGFINSISEPFCKDCTRLRMSVDGVLYTCLFAHNGHSIKEKLILTNEELEDHIKKIWESRDDRYSEKRGRLKTLIKGKPEMFAIGG